MCEDALSILGNGNALVSGGGAQGADDKIIQHNGVGTVTIDGFYAEVSLMCYLLLLRLLTELLSVQNFGKLYRSCGNCKASSVGTSTPRRNVIVKNVKAYNGKVLTGINS